MQRNKEIWFWRAFAATLIAVTVWMNAGWLKPELERLRQHDCHAEVVKAGNMAAAQEALYCLSVLTALSP